MQAILQRFNGTYHLLNWIFFPQWTEIRCRKEKRLQISPQAFIAIRKERLMLDLGVGSILVSKGPNTFHEFHNESTLVDVLSKNSSFSGFCSDTLISHEFAFLSNQTAGFWWVHCLVTHTLIQKNNPY